MPYGQATQQWRACRPTMRRVGKSEPRKLKLTWKVTPLTAENDPDGSLRERQLQVIRRLLIRAGEEAKADNLTETIDPPRSASRSERAYATV